MRPEDPWEIVWASATRFDAFVAKYMGDAVLVYFGDPRAHEDDAEPLVRAGRELGRPASVLRSTVPLQARSAGQPGRSSWGDPIGTGVAERRAVVGETPNLAAHLQGIIRANEIVFADNTRRPFDNPFERDLKSIIGPVRVWGDAASPWRAISPRCSPPA
jgi:class 3 adenylate cyclase